MKRLVIPAIFGATTLIITGIILDKTPLDSIPGAQKYEIIVDPSIGGIRAVGLIIENTAQAKKLADILIASSTTQTLKDGSTIQKPIITFNGIAVEVFFAVREKDYGKIMADLPLDFSGGIVFNNKDENIEERLILYMKEHSIQTYEIITL